MILRTKYSLVLAGVLIYTPFNVIYYFDEVNHFFSTIVYDN